MLAHKMCCFNVLKCPKTAFGTCELVGSFQTEDGAKKCKEQAEKFIDGNFIIILHKFEYEVEV